MLYQRYIVNLALLVCTAFILSAHVPANAQSKPESLSIKTGVSGGGFYVIGAGLSKIFSDNGVRSNPELGGGNANIISLSRNEDSIGLAQAVAFTMAARGEPPFPSKIKNLSAIAVLFSNVVQVVVSKESNIKHLCVSEIR